MSRVFGTNRRAESSTRAALARFAIGSAAAVAVAVVGGYFALRSVAIDEAKREARLRVQETAQLVEAVLDDGILAGDPASLAAVDDIVVGRILSDSVVRAKIWSAEGAVLYSDDQRQIGGRFPLSAEQRALLGEGGAAVEVGDLDSPENVLDRGHGDLIEAYTTIRTPSGTPLLFEVYERFESVSTSAGRLLRALAPPVLGAFALIVLVQAPLVWSLARRLRRGYEERESLLAAAIDASSRERRRVASYLHDGAVQDIAGIAFALAPIADRAEARGDTRDAAEVRASVERLRGNVRDLRALLVDLHPPNLAAQGLEAALSDLVGPLEARDVEVTVRVDGADRLDRERQGLVYRVAQEAIRNIVAYADARSVWVELGVSDSTARLRIADDGRGFGPDDRARRGAEGHVGLALLEGLAVQAGGALRIRSAPGRGTEIELELPCA